MNIDNYLETIKFCRFCFMCRHLSAIGNVTFTEADTPRVRASMIYGATIHPELFANEDLIKTMYRSDLSGCCRRNCVNHYDEVGLTLAYRADLVEAGKVPEYIKTIATALMNSPEWSVSGKGKVAYVADNYSVESGASAAFGKLAKEFRTVSGGSCGKGLWVLGFRKEAKLLAEKFLKALEGVETVVVSHTGIFDFLVNTIGEMGLKLDAKVMHTSEYLAGVKTARPLGDLYYLESDYLRNYNSDYPYPRALLTANGANLKPFGTNDEESYSCAEGALLLDKIEPELVEKLAKYIEARADNPAKDVIVTASPYTRIQLGRFTSLKVKTIEELLAEAL